jgi:hypothetical protein
MSRRLARRDGTLSALSTQDDCNAPEGPPQRYYILKEGRMRGIVIAAVVAGCTGIIALFALRDDPLSWARPDPAKLTVTSSKVGYTNFLPREASDSTKVELEAQVNIVKSGSQPLNDCVVILVARNKDSLGKSAYYKGLYKTGKLWMENFTDRPVNNPIKIYFLADKDAGAESGGVLEFKCRGKDVAKSAVDKGASSRS